MKGPVFGLLLLAGAGYLGYWVGKKTCAAR
jgi:hypothetical protein